MNPVIVIILILLGIGGAYFVITNLADAQISVNGVDNAALTTYGILAAKVLIAVLILYGICYIVAAFKTAAAQRKMKERSRSRQ